MVSTVYHEALHARFEQLFPRLTGSPVWGTISAHVNEITAYAIGGAARVARGQGIIDRLGGLLEVLLSPWLAYGSMNSFLEALPLIIRDAAGLVLYLRWLIRQAEQLARGPGESEVRTQ